jgi:hypothetical protein
MPRSLLSEENHCQLFGLYAPFTAGGFSELVAAELQLHANLRGAEFLEVLQLFFGGAEAVAGVIRVKADLGLPVRHEY